MSKPKEESGSIRWSYFTVERALDAIFWIDSGGQIYQVNEAACRLLGYSRDELIGVPISYIIRKMARFGPKSGQNSEEKRHSHSRIICSQKITKG
jgi:PAS domain S-box-containing protein